MVLLSCCGICGHSELGLHGTAPAEQGERDGALPRTLSKGSQTPTGQTLIVEEGGFELAPLVASAVRLYEAAAAPGEKLPSFIAGLFRASEWGSRKKRFLLISIGDQQQELY